MPRSETVIKLLQVADSMSVLRPRTATRLLVGGIISATRVGFTLRNVQENMPQLPMNVLGPLSKTRRRTATHCCDGLEHPATGIDPARLGHRHAGDSEGKGRH